jgi:hypothetical protein
MTISTRAVSHRISTRAVSHRISTRAVSHRISTPRLRTDREFARNRDLSAVSTNGGSRDRCSRNGGSRDGDSW